MAYLKVVQSSKDNSTWFSESEWIPMEDDLQEEENNLLMFYSDIRYQTVRGFGGALTEASAYNYFRMSDELKSKFLNACYSKEGLDYAFGRTHIGSCDFSFGNYSYCDKSGDEGLTSFNVSRDQQSLLPFLKEINSFRKKPLVLIATPWSPPAWMKSNGSMLNGGALKPELYDIWADYFVKYLQAYSNEGVPIQYLSVQNEPKAKQVWESCVFTSEQEMTFVRDSLAPTLEKNALNVGILIWDHNKERVFLRARKIFSDPKMRSLVKGIAFHWYSGDHFDNLRLCKEFFPEKELVFTEGCIELAAKETIGSQENKQDGEPLALFAPWESGERYANDIIGNFNSGMNTFLDWNVLLNEHGGPNHVGNYCSAPIIYNSATDELLFQPSYCFLRHFSRYIQPGSRLIAHSCYHSDLMSACFLEPDGTCVIMAFNKTSRDIPFKVKDVVSGKIAPLVSPARSISTVICVS